MALHMNSLAKRGEKKNLITWGHTTSQELLKLSIIGPQEFLASTPSLKWALVIYGCVLKLNGFFGGQRVTLSDKYSNFLMLLNRSFYYQQNIVERVPFSPHMYNLNTSPHFWAKHRGQTVMLLRNILSACCLHCLNIISISKLLQELWNSPPLFQNKNHTLLHSHVKPCKCICFTFTQFYIV